MELAIAIKTASTDQKRYQDGDIVQTFTNRRIHLAHAQMICRPGNFPLNTFGLRERDTLFEKYMAKTSQYRFTRLNTHDVQRLNLITDEEEVLNTTPNVNGEAIDVAMFVKRRIQHAQHKIFGTVPGREVWYGGKIPRNESVVATVWNDIETHTDSLQDDHGHWPFSETERRTLLPLNCTGYKTDVEEISDPTARERCACVYRTEDVPDVEDEQVNIIVAKRQWQVPYWDLASSLGIDIDDVRNKSKEVDVRSDAPLIERNKIDDINLDKVSEGIVTI